MTEVLELKQPVLFDPVTVYEVLLVGLTTKGFPVRVCVLLVKV